MKVTNNLVFKKINMGVEKPNEVYHFLKPIPKNHNTDLDFIGYTPEKSKKLEKAELKDKFDDFGKDPNIKPEIFQTVSELVSSGKITLKQGVDLLSFFSENPTSSNKYETYEKKFGKRQYIDNYIKPPQKEFPLDTFIPEKPLKPIIEKFPPIKAFIINKTILPSDYLDPETGKPLK